MAHDRAWRNPASRPISPLNVITRAGPEAKGAVAAHAASPAGQADATPEPDRERAGLPAAMTVMIAVNFGAVLGLVGWPVLQAFGVVGEPAIETVQRSQAELMSRLDASVQDPRARGRPPRG